MLASSEIPTETKFQVWYFPGWVGCGGYVVGCGGYVLGGWGKIENKAKLSPSKAGARAELGNSFFSGYIVIEGSPLSYKIKSHPCP